jgi:hypothetical protein
MWYTLESFTNFTKRAELTVSESRSAATKVEKIVSGIYHRNFHITPGKNINGINATRVVSVPAISGAL